LPLRRPRPPQARRLAADGRRHQRHQMLSGQANGSGDPCRTAKGSALPLSTTIRRGLADPAATSTTMRRPAALECRPRYGRTARRMGRRRLQLVGIPLHLKSTPISSPIGGPRLLSPAGDSVHGSSGAGAADGRRWRSPCARARAVRRAQARCHCRFPAKL
jgi:hypothetical protein